MYSAALLLALRNLEQAACMASIRFFDMDRGLTQSVLQTSAYLTSAPNPNVLYGALPAGANNTDNYVDIRTNSNSQVQLDFTAGIAGVMAGLQEAPGSWEQCLQVCPEPQCR